MKVKKLVTIALLIAISFIGANLFFPGTTIAFDSMPAFFAALFISPVAGALVGAIGHFFTSFLKGFPMSLPIHLIIMGTMALTMIAFGYTYKIVKGGEGVKLALAAAVGVIVNAPVSLYFVSLMMGKGIFVLLPILSLGAFLNVLVAILLFKAIKRSAKYEE